MADLDGNGASDASYLGRHPFVLGMIAGAVGQLAIRLFDLVMEVR
jgi:hypothetical protein